MITLVQADLTSMILRGVFWLRVRSGYYYQTDEHCGITADQELSWLINLPL